MNPMAATTPPCTTRMRSCEAVAQSAQDYAWWGLSILLPFDSSALYLVTEL